MIRFQYTTHVIICLIKYWIFYTYMLGFGVFKSYTRLLFQHSNKIYKANNISYHDNPKL